jgi:WD40 repeat protein
VLDVTTGSSRVLYASPAMSHATVATLAYSADGARVAGGEIGNDTEVFVWDVASGSIVTRVAAPSSYGLSLSPDGQWVASADGATRDLLAFHLPDGARTDYAALAEPKFRAGANDNHYDLLTFSASGKRLAATSFYNVSTVVFRVSDGTPEYVLPNGSAGLFFLDENTLLRGELDGTVGVWCLR